MCEDAETGHIIMELKQGRRLMKKDNILKKVFELMNMGKADELPDDEPRRSKRTFKRFSLLKKCSLKGSNSTTLKT